MTVYVGVGSNIDRKKHARVAIKELAELDPQLRVSSIYESAPVGFEGEPFYNFVVALKTSNTLADFSDQLRKIEIKWGRGKDAEKFQDRSLDLDILLFGEQVSLHSPTVPRKDIFIYPFVIQPLYELCPDLIIPNDGRSVTEIWQNMKDKHTLTKVDLSYSNLENSL